MAITGQVGTPLLGRDAFQGVDVTGITMPITKYNFLVQSTDELAAILREAFFVAREGRSGPVLVDVPRNVLTAECEYYPAQPDPHSGEKSAPADTVPMQKAVQLFLNAKRPVMLIGGGAVLGQAQAEAIQFAELTGIPVVSTLMGLGAFPSSFPGFLGLTGMHGHRAANLTIAQSDLILAVGSRFSDRVTGDRNLYAEGKVLIHLDVDASEIGRNITANVELIGNLRKGLSEMTACLQARPRPSLAEWRNQVECLRQGDISCLDSNSLNPQWIMRHMSEAISSRQVAWVTDVGQHQMWAAQHLNLTQPRSWITSGGMGTMGFGLPAAMGAQLACPDSRVVAICGDGGLQNDRHGASHHCKSSNSCYLCHHQ